MSQITGSKYQSIDLNIYQILGGGAYRPCHRYVSTTSILRITDVTKTSVGGCWFPDLQQIQQSSQLWFLG